MLNFRAPAIYNFIIVTKNLVIVKWHKGILWYIYYRYILCCTVKSITLLTKTNWKQCSSSLENLTHCMFDLLDVSTFILHQRWSCHKTVSPMISVMTCALYTQTWYRVDSTVNDHSSRFHPVPLHKLRFSDGNYQDVCLFGLKNTATQH